MNNRYRKLFAAHQDDEPGSWTRRLWVDPWYDRHRLLVAELRRLKSVLGWEAVAKERALIRVQIILTRGEIESIRSLLRSDPRVQHLAEWAECTRQCWSANGEKIDHCDCRCIGEFHGLLAVAVYKEVAIA